MPKQWIPLGGRTRRHLGQPRGRVNRGQARPRGQPSHYQVAGTMRHNLKDCEPTLLRIVYFGIGLTGQALGS